ncbi:MAG: serine O-acetyltransferase [Clostridia bacterium]|nr:serine O-acetyltransferase [Clostridia bacterium]
MKKQENKSDILDAFFDGIDKIRYDIKQIRDRDPAATSDWEVALLYSGFHAVTAHRLSHKLHKKGYHFTARALSQTTKFFTGIEIHPGAKIGKGVFIDHGAGVVIGETAEVGDNCTIYQGVTLGGTGKHAGKRHPTLGDNVMVGAGAKVLGPFTVGSGTKIAAGAVVLDSVPENATAVGIPARVVRIGNVKTGALDQIHIPDPVSQELCKMNARIDKLEKQLAAKEKLLAALQEKKQQKESQSEKKG